MNHNIRLYTLILITTHKLAEKANDMFRKAAVPIQYNWNAVGTASSEMIDVLGLGSPERCVLISFLPKSFAEEMLKKLKKELKLGKVNSGIAFTVPMAGASNLIVNMTQTLEKDEKREVEAVMNNTKYYIIAAVVNQGYSENVMEAARAAGARGGTVVPARSIGNQQAMAFGMSIQDEKDAVLIVAGNENKLKIMQAIGEKCGMHSDAKGIVVSLPIDSVIGMSEDD